MKFNKLALVFFIALLTVFTAACGGGTAATKEASTGSGAVDQGEKVALPEEGPALIGKVKEIIGNEVTVYKAQAHSTGQNQDQAQGQNPGQSQAQGQAQSQGQNQAQGQNATQSAQAQPQSQNESQPQGQNGGQDSAQAQNPAQSQNRRSQGGGARFSFSGETETFLIPVGTPIVTIQRGVGTASQAGLSDIKKDMVLMIWKKDDIVTFVQVAGGSGTRQSGGAAGTGTRQGTGAGTGTGAGAGGLTHGAGGFAPGAGGFTPGAGGGNR